MILPTDVELIAGPEATADDLRDTELAVEIEWFVAFDINSVSRLSIQPGDLLGGGRGVEDERLRQVCRAW